MTGALFGSILILAVLAWASLAAMHANDDAPQRKVAMVFLAIAPVALFASIVVWALGRAPAGEYRVALEAVEFDLSAGGNVTVGGGTEGAGADDVVIRDLPPNFLSFRAEGNQVTARLPGDLDHSTDDPIYAAVRVDGERPFANTWSLAGEDRVTIRAREAMTFNVSGQTFESKSAAFPPIPKRRQELAGNITIPIARNLRAETVMFPVRFWARPSASSEPVVGTDGAPLGSFLSYDSGLFRRTLYVTLTGDGTSLVLGDGTRKRYDPKIATIAPNGHRDFALFRLDYSDPRVGFDSRSAAQERRSFRATYRGGRLALVLDTPDFVRLSSSSVARLVKDQEEKGTFLLATRDPRRSAPVIANQMVLSFPLLGPRVQNEAYSAIRVSDSGPCIVRVTSHMGARCYASGEAFRLGDRAASILRVTRMTIPWGVILTMAALGLFSLFWMQRHERDTTALIIVSAAEVLLAVRLLIAFEGALLDPSAASALWESLVIFALVPFVLRMAWTFNRARREDPLPTFAEAGRSLGWLGLVETVGVNLLIAMALARAGVDLKVILGTCAATLALPLAAGWLGARVLDLVVDGVRSMRWLVIFFFSILIVRLFMMFVAGWKERISVGGADLALTVLYLPVVFLFTAVVWERYRQSRITPMALLWIALMGVTLTIVIPIVVKDSGSMLVHLPAILLLLALPLLDRRTGETWLLGAPLLALIAFHGVFLFLPYFRGGDTTTSGDYQKALQSETDANQFLEARLKQSRNQQRLMSHIAPHLLQEAGTSSAEGLVMQRKMLDRFSGRGLWGAGYLNVPLATFRDTHLNDNLSAIHILAPFGLAGAAGVLAVLVAIALLPLAVSFAGNDEIPERAIDARAALGILALWTFSIAGIYMVAANVGVVLFTGKNVYLLAAASKSDAIEGGMLLWLGLMTLIPAKIHATTTP